MNRYILFVPCNGSENVYVCLFFCMHVYRKPLGRILGYGTSSCLTKVLPALNLHETVFDMLPSLCVTRVSNRGYSITDTPACLHSSVAPGLVPLRLLINTRWESGE